MVEDEELTRSVLDEDGWFDTGDIIRLVGPHNDLVFVGRAKETIVLSGGENVEPEPIENSILRAPGIAQVMLVGQDRKTLAALVVCDPDARPDDAAIRAELDARTGTAGGFRSFEAVRKFAVLDEPFSTENGLLTQTLKMRRTQIAEQHAETIARLYA
jgi:long-chain acyl-CoA synthetase